MARKLLFLWLEKIVGNLYACLLHLASTDVLLQSRCTFRFSFRKIEHFKSMSRCYYRICTGAVQHLWRVCFGDHKISRICSLYDYASIKESVANLFITVCEEASEGGVENSKGLNVVWQSAIEDRWVMVAKWWAGDPAFQQSSLIVISEVLPFLIRASLINSPLLNNSIAKTKFESVNELLTPILQLQTQAIRSNNLLLIPRMKPRFVS